MHNRNDGLEKKEKATFFRECLVFCIPCAWCFKNTKHQTLNTIPISELRLINPAEPAFAFLEITQYGHEFFS